jgi:Na+/melibiose symporter-like transporter
MPTKLLYTILFIAALGCFFSCSPKHISTKYYYENEKVLDKMEETYKELSRQQPFTLAFTSKSFKTVALEIITDSLSYIYEFGVDEPRLADSLVAYGLNAPKVIRWG